MISFVMDNLKICMVEVGLKIKGKGKKKERKLSTFCSPQKAHILASGETKKKPIRLIVKFENKFNDFGSLIY